MANSGIPSCCLALLDQVSSKTPGLPAGVLTNLEILIQAAIHKWRLPTPMGCPRVEGRVPGYAYSSRVRDEDECVSHMRSMMILRKAWHERPNAKGREGRDAMLGATAASVAQMFSSKWVRLERRDNVDPLILMAKEAKSTLNMFQDSEVRYLGKRDVARRVQDMVDVADSILNAFASSGSAGAPSASQIDSVACGLTPAMWNFRPCSRTLHTHTHTQERGETKPQLRQKCVNGANACEHKGVLRGACQVAS